MATNLVKWWKTRFLNGYKQFTVLMPADSTSEGGRPSDTEELLSSVAPNFSPPPALHHHAPTPPVAATSAPPSAPARDACCCGQGECTPRRELKFEEFECDVAVQGDGPADDPSLGVTPGTGSQCRQCGPPRQEFSFTLYDLDGHGKITKDDIAGLVTTIYETLGATIQVPHTGSKTIRVRLTVAPEHRNNANNVSDTQQPPNNQKCQKTTDNSPKPLHKLSCNNESLYQNLSPSKLSNNAEQLYSQLNLSPLNKSKNEVYYTQNSPSSCQKHGGNSDSVHFCQHKGSSMGQKIATIRVCNNDTCSPSNQPIAEVRLYNKEDSPCNNDTKPSVHFCNNTESLNHNNILPFVNDGDTPLSSRKFSSEGLKRDRLSGAKVPSASLSTPNSPMRLGNPTRASVSVSSPRGSGRKVVSHSSSPARSRRRTTTAAASSTAAAAAHSGPPAGQGAGSGIGGRERAYSGTLQRQELLHIIQANMEKNLLALHHNTTHQRKRCGQGEDVPLSHSHHRHHSTTHQRNNLPSTRKTSKANSSRQPPRKTTRTTVDPTNNVISCSHFYLDLAGLEATSLCPHCDKGKDKVHARSKSHDTTTHHLLKHKTRELDHARAMAQVVEWLQGAQLGSGPSAVQEEEEDDQEEGDAGDGTRTHRHIHEHVHHHYHHYTDSTLVV